MRKTWLTAPFLLLAFALSGVPAMAAPDVAFLQSAIAADNGEIALGRLAQARGQDRRTRDFGRVLVRDHQAAKQEVLAVMRQSRLPVDPAAVNPDARRASRQLSRLHGREFDRIFTRHMVEDHRQDIARFEKQAAGGEPVTSRLARQTLPHLRHHLDLAQALDH